MAALAMILPLAVHGLTAESPRFVPEESVFAVITHRAGIAAGLAHDHLVTAPGATVQLDFDPEAPLRTRMELQVEAEQLVVDAPESRRRWSPRLKELGVLDDLLGELSEKNRQKIRRSMLGRSQLAAEEFPEVLASVVEVREIDSVEGDSFAFEVELALTVRGQTATRTVSAGYSVSRGRVLVEALGSFRFTDFGIKPYSAMLGAVRNRDEFHVYVRLLLTADSSAPT